MSDSGRLLSENGVIMLVHHMFIESNHLTTVSANHADATNTRARVYCLIVAG